MAITLASLKSGKELKAPLVLFYGTRGIGKSSWAAEAPDAVFLPVEEGVNNIDCTKFPTPRTIDDVYGAINALRTEQHGFKALIIDTIDRYEQLVHKAVRTKYGDTIFADFGKGFKYSIPYFEDLLTGLKLLRDERNMMVILIGHEKIFHFNSPESPAYDRYAPDLHESVAPMVEEAMDVVLFGNYKTYVIKEDVGFGKQEGKATGKGDRVIYTQERPPFRAKNRYNLPAELPMKFDSFLRGIEEGMRAGKPGAAKVALPAGSESVTIAQPQSAGVVQPAA